MLKGLVSGLREAMSASKRLECNLQAVQKLLSQLHGHPCFEQVTKSQAGTFEKILNSTSTIAAEEAVALNALVISSAFSPGDQESFDD